MNSAFLILSPLCSPLGVTYLLGKMSGLDAKLDHGGDCVVGLLELGSQPSAGSVHTQLSGTRASPRSALPTRSLLSWHSCHLARLTSSQPLALLHILLQHGVTCRGERHQGVGTSEHPVSVSQFCSVFCATRITPCGSGNSGSQLPRRLSDNPLSSGWGSLISGAGSDPACPLFAPRPAYSLGALSPGPGRALGPSVGRALRSRYP